jgi:nitrogen-specific signal transduction histidine kinase/ActR/RegA family two-component response regulator
MSFGPVRRGDEVSGVVMVARDITQQKQSEAKLIGADRMAAMGMLAAGVAHEINNPLTSVVANLDLLSRELPAAVSDDSRGRLLEVIRDASEAALRIRDIARDIRVFSRAEEQQTRPVDVHHVLDSALRIVAVELRYRARLVTHFEPVPAVEASESRLAQVFVNLITNAAQAIPLGRAEENQVRVSTRLDASGKVVVEVSDSGVGMPAETVKRIFEPFFTTKGAPEGTGLGLAICDRIVRDLGGEIVVESEPGRGSRFLVELPASRSAPPAVVAAAPVPAASGRAARLLVVDDEETILSVVESILEAEHDVAVSARAREALARLRAGERFDLVLCDLTLLDMTGMELHAKVAAFAPEQADRFIFMTGGALSTAAQSFLESVSRPYLEKPFGLRALQAFVNEQLAVWELASGTART